MPGMVLDVLYVLTLSTTPKTGILVPFYNGRKPVRSERLSHLPKVTQTVREQLESSRALESRLTVRARKGEMWDQSQGEGGATGQPQPIYMTSLQLLAVAATVSLPIPGRKEPRAASGTRCH